MINTDLANINLLSKLPCRGTVSCKNGRSITVRVRIDHIDGVNKQNVLSNLREASHSENMRNRAKSKTKCTSKYLGVYLCSRSNKWRVGIKSNQEKIDLGRYESEEEAAMVYNRAALARHKEFANLNLIASESVLGLAC